MALNYQPKQNNNNLKGTVSQNMETLNGPKPIEDPGAWETFRDTGRGNIEKWTEEKVKYAAQPFQKRDYVGQAIKGALDSSNERADAYTGQTAIQNASDNLNKYESVGRAEGAQMSTNDDAYQAAAFKEQNLQQNRINTLQDTINEGQALLKGYNMDVNAAGLAEAQQLLNQSKSQMQLADMMSTLSSMLKYSKGLGGKTK